MYPCWSCLTSSWSVTLIQGISQRTPSMKKVDNPVNYTMKLILRITEKKSNENDVEISLQFVFYGPYALAISIPTAG